MAKKKNIWEIDEAKAEIARLLEDNGGVIDDETEARLHALLDEQEDKWENYVDLIGDFQAMVEAASFKKRKAEAARKKWDNAAKRLRDRLAESLKRNGKEKVETAAGTAYFSTRTNERLQLKEGVDIDFLNPLYVKKTVTLDEDQIRRTLADPESPHYREASESFEIVTEESKSLTVR